MTYLPSVPVRSNEHVMHVIQGSFKVSRDQDAILMTILGSCVATCLWDPVAKAGGMNHFLLANEPDKCAVGYRQGLHAMELLINGLLKLGAQRNRLQAKVFGGAMMQNKFGRIGRANAEFALHFLKNEGIQVVAQSLGGTMARRIRFSPTSGMAQQRLLDDENAPPLAPIPVFDDDIIIFEE